MAEHAVGGDRHRDGQVHPTVVISNCFPVHEQEFSSKSIKTFVRYCLRVSDGSGRRRIGVLDGAGPLVDSRAVVAVGDGQRVRVHRQVRGAADGAWAGNPVAVRRVDVFAAALYSISSVYTRLRASLKEKRDWTISASSRRLSP